MKLCDRVLLLLLATVGSCGHGSGPNAEFRADLDKLLVMWRLPPLSAWDRQIIPKRDGDRNLSLHSKTGQNLTARLSDSNWMWLLRIEGEVGEPLLEPESIRIGDFRALSRVHPFLAGSIAKRADRAPRSLNEERAEQDEFTHLTLYDRKGGMLGFVVLKSSGHITHLYWPRNLRSPHLKQIRP